MVTRNPSEEDAERARAAELEAWRFAGFIDGFVYALVVRGSANTEFDQNEWESLYGEYITYHSYRIPSMNLTAKEAERYLVTDWDHAKEKNYLPEGNDLPKDRDGMLIFENGTAALTRGGKRYLIELRESEYQLLEKLSEVRMEILREGYGRISP